MDVLGLVLGLRGQVSVVDGREQDAYVGVRASAHQVTSVTSVTRQERPWPPTHRTQFQALYWHNCVGTKLFWVCYIHGFIIMNFV